jgi:endonuclease/exonuclease/phosphatase family metal-dependent hydrolase
MTLTIGTFNLNNLFSRWNLYVDVGGEDGRPAWLGPATGGADHIDVEVTTDGQGPRWHWRRFAGHDVFGKSPRAQREVADRLLAGGADVWALQEVESDTALHDFCDEHGLTAAGYTHRVVLPGNDLRLINVAVISRNPLGAVTSWRFTPDPADPDSPVFSRDLLQVEVLSPGGDERVLTVFVTHLKSQLARSQAEQRAATARRRRQAEAIAAILHRLGGRRRLGPFALLGDMNAVPDAPELGAFDQAGLALPLLSARETAPYDPDDPSRPPTPAWTHRFKPAGRPAQYGLYDQIWVPRSMSPRVQETWIVRRHSRGGDGSDHDPALLALAA